ncbi:MAG: threonine aldolase family protein [Pikeienuella sp.]
MWFTSDNAAGAAPEVLEALARANEGYAGAYGGDPLTARVQDMIRETFEAPDAAVHFVATGTAANSLALACLTPSWSGVYCHRAAHIEVDECGAPEFFTGGAKMVLVDGDDGLMTPDALDAVIPKADGHPVHHVQRGALSLTNATECGTVYTPADVRALTDIAKAKGAPVHMDGTRFANAIATLGCSPAELSWKAGVDILCLGATKNGALAAEAVIIFDPDMAWEFELRRKRGGHLFSKMRFVAAQFEAMMTNDLWLRNARHANAMADQLAGGILSIRGGSLMHPRQANLVFASLPRAAHKAAMAKGAAYHFWPMSQAKEGPDDEPVSCRLVCSSQTRESDVDAILAAFRSA